MLSKWRRSHEESSRHKALAELDRQQQLLRPAYKIWGYKNVFAKGYLITPGATHYRPRENWLSREFGAWRVQLDPELEHQHALADTAEVLVLGQIFDERGPAKRHLIASRILRAAGQGPAALDELVTWLSGRFVILVRQGNRLTVYGDPMATRSCYWHKLGGGIALASHTALLANVAGGLSSNSMQWVLTHPDYKSPAGKWLPGLITPHDGVGQLYANCRLTLEGATVTHQRFFPKHDRVEVPESEATETFQVELRNQIRNWMSIAPTTVLALTAGADSRAILETGIVDFQMHAAVALTYHPFHVAKKTTYDDLVTANRLAAAARLRHIVLDVRQMSRTSQMATLYNTTFPTWKRYANLASALYVGAPARAATLFGIGGGIVTGMITGRQNTQLTPQVLAEKYAYSNFAKDRRLHDELARWMEYTQFSDDALRGYDFYDFFHWEHRMSKWGATGYSEYDLAPIPAPVLNSRRLLVAALSVSWEARQRKVMYRHISREEPAV